MSVPQTRAGPRFVGRDLARAHGEHTACGVWEASSSAVLRTLEAWRDDYDNRRPHSSLADVPPVEFRTGACSALGRGQLRIFARLVDSNWGGAPIAADQFDRLITFGVTALV